MTWIEKIENLTFSIQTGDGEIYTPELGDIKLTVEFYVGVFDLYEQNGSYVRRGTHKGGVYPLDFYFRGLDHLDKKDAFLASAMGDKNLWLIKSPYFDDLMVQPTSIDVESLFGETHITCTTIVTSELLPNKANLSDLIKEEINDSNDNIINTIEADSVSSSQSSIITLSSAYESLSTTNGEALLLKGYIREATLAAVNILSEPVKYNNTLKNLIYFPSETSSSVNASVYAVNEAFNSLLKVVDLDISILDLHSTLSLNFLCEYCISYNYSKQTEIAYSQSTISNIYQAQIEAFESRNYVQSPVTASYIKSTVSNSLGELINKSVNSLREYNFEVEKNQSYILLTNKYYGISDDNLTRFEEENNLSIAELVEVSKGRKIVVFL